MKRRCRCRCRRWCWRWRRCCCWGWGWCCGIALIPDHYRVIKVISEVIGATEDKNFAVSLNCYHTDKALHRSENMTRAVKCSIQRAVCIEASNTETRARVTPGETGGYNLPVCLNRHRSKINTDRSSNFSGAAK